MGSGTCDQILTGLAAVGTIAYGILNRNNYGNNCNARRVCCQPIYYPQDCFQSSRLINTNSMLNQHQCRRDPWGDLGANSFRQGFNQDYYDISRGSDIEAKYGIQDSENSLSGLIDPKDVLNTSKLTPEAYTDYVVSKVLNGTQVINNGIIHDGDNIPDPNYLIKASLGLKNLGAKPVIALEVQNTENNRKLLKEFMSNPQISGEDLIDELFGGRANYYKNDRIYGLLEAARTNQIPVALIDGNLKEISRDYKNGDYSYSRDDAMFDNIKGLTNRGYTVLTLLGLAHVTELTEDRIPNKQERNVLIHPERTLGTLLQDSGINTYNLALVNQNKNLNESDLEKIENEDPAFIRNTEKLSLEFAGFDQVFRIE